MRKFRNLVIGGIENKLFNLILLTVVLLTAASVIVSVHHSNMLKELAEESAQRQETSMVEITQSVMNSVVEQSMGRSTEMEAYLANDLFQGLQGRVEMLADYAQKLFSDPGAYPRVEVSGPETVENGKIATQLLTAEGVDISGEVLRDKIGLAANLSDLMVALYSTSEETNSCFISLPEGVTLATDDRSGSKLDDAGRAMPFPCTARPWYKLAEEQGKLIFTDVEKDAFTGKIGIVCAAPIYVNGELAAIVGSDLFLTSMEAAVQASAANGGYVLVVNEKGHVVFAPGTQEDFSVKASGEAEDLRQSSISELGTLVRDAMEQKTNVRSVPLKSGESYMMGAPMKTVGWTLLSVQSVASAQKPATMLKEAYEQIQAETAEIYQKKTDASRNTALVLLLAATALMLTGSLVLGKRIVKPLNTMTRRIGELGDGNMVFTMENTYRTGDEVEELAKSFAALSHKTMEYVDKVKTATAEKERLTTELSLATSIQTAMLPHIFPAFPEKQEFDVFASMDPAREVGGDFYDFFLIDGDHLCLTIADVSGKGVPAALMMMASKIILQSYAKMGKSPREILSLTNQSLCTNNEAEMFVTAWLGILELSTGKLTAANAGHEYPVFRKTGGRYEICKDRHGFVLGGLKDVPYREYEIDMTPGSSLFVYTDGLPEATDANNEAFGMERMLTTINERPEASPRDVLQHMRGAVDGFVKDAEQFDDLTMLCLTYKGKQSDGGETA